MIATKFKESEYYSIELNRGLYLIDGNTVDVDSYNLKVQVKDITSVKPILRQKIIQYYIHQDIDNSEKLSTKKYDDEKDELSKFRTYNDDLEDYSWSSLDREFDYRKFIAKWTAVYKDIETIGDPYSFDVRESVIDTGCQFVKSEYINGGSDPMMYVYERHGALLGIVANKFKELGLEYKNGISYEQTRDKKFWGNSSHSCIRYVVAFGTYIFNDSWNTSTFIRGTLESMLARYNTDKEKLENEIQIKYDTHFGKIDLEGFDFKTLHVGLNSCKLSFGKVIPKSSGINDYRYAMKRLNECISQIESSYKVTQ